MGYIDPTRESRQARRDRRSVRRNNRSARYQANNANRALLADQRALNATTTFGRQYWNAVSESTRGNIEYSVAKQRRRNQWNRSRGIGTGGTGDYSTGLSLDFSVAFTGPNAGLIFDGLHFNMGDFQFDPSFDVLDGNKPAIEIVPIPEGMLENQPLWPIYDGNNQTSEANIGRGWGVHINPFTGVPKFHYGLDIEAPGKLVAILEGTVTNVGYNETYGNYIEINYGLYSSKYGHMESMSSFVKGNIVAKGTVVGVVGNTGESTGPHLHYEIRRDGTLIDPMTIYHY
jgi:murein DD-endopeptidase MepM/ murein hydrolase activator NlpD